MGIGQFPIYKSRNELVVFSKLDTDAAVTRWGYEILDIPYFNRIDSKIHKYKVDIYCEVQRGGQLIKCLIEIKSKEDLHAPVKPTLINRRSRDRYNFAVRTYIVNSCKWKAAIEFCKKANFKMMLLTEDDIQKT